MSKKHNKFNDNLDMLLYINHKNDLCSDSRNIHLFAFETAFNILHNNTESFTSSKYYKKSEAYRKICTEIKNNIPKTIFMKDKYGDYVLNVKHKKYDLYIILVHAMEFALMELGF